MAAVLVFGLETRPSVVATAIQGALIWIGRVHVQALFEFAANPTTTSSVIAAMAGESSKASPGALCLSGAENGSMSYNQ